MTNDVGTFAVLAGFNLTTTNSYHFNFDITINTITGNNVQFTIAATQSSNIKVKSLAFSVLIWNRDKIETAAILTRIFYQLFNK